MEAGIELLRLSQRRRPGRVALSAPPAATKTVIDLPSSRKTFIENEEGDCDCFYRERS